MVALQIEGNWVLIKGPETPRAEEGKPDRMGSRRLSLTPLWLLCSLWGYMGHHPMLHSPLLLALQQGPLVSPPTTALAQPSLLTGSSGMG